MKRFIEGGDRSQTSLLPECLDDYVVEDNPVRVVDAFVEQLDLQSLEFEGMEPELTGRPVNRRARLTRSRRPRLTSETRGIMLKLLSSSGSSPGPRRTPVSAEIWSMFDAGSQAK